MRSTLATCITLFLFLFAGPAQIGAQYRTNVHHGLALESEIHDVSDDKKALDAIITAANSRIPKKKGLDRHQAIGALQTIHQILQQQEPRFISHILRENDCKTSIIYTAVGEALGLPIKAVVIPGHIFVRYELDSGEFINWETLYGTTVSDDDYIREHRIAEISVMNGAYMRTLNPSEITALHHVILGKAWARKENHDRAMRNYNEAVRRYPSCPGCYNQRGIGWLQLRNPDNAVRDLNEAINLDPQYVNAFYNRALAYLQQSRFYEAAADLDYVLELNPEHANSYYWRGFINMKIGNRSKAVKDHRKSIELDQNLRYNPDYTR